MKMRVAELHRVQLLQEAGAKKVFLVNGGMMMHLVDTLGRHGGLEYVAQHHHGGGASAIGG